MDLENKVSKKADNTSILQLGDKLGTLEEKVGIIIGGEGNISLTNLEERVSETESDLKYLLGTEETEEVGTKGKVKEIEDSIQNLQNDICRQKEVRQLFDALLNRPVMYHTHLKKLFLSFS